MGAVFGISESYCHKVYSRTARMLAIVKSSPTVRLCWKSLRPS
ncbi:hypothetical protein [Methylovulum psychrotolerans]|nr:hypothetical protein [Methylovulum psychrotolerans]